MLKAIAAGALTALLALAVALPVEQSAAMSRPKKTDRKDRRRPRAKPSPARKIPSSGSTTSSGWNSIDDEHIVFYGGAGKAALVTTFGPCSGLNYRGNDCRRGAAPLSRRQRARHHYFQQLRQLHRADGARSTRSKSVKDLKEAKALVATRKAEKAMEEHQELFLRHSRQDARSAACPSAKCRTR